MTAFQVTRYQKFGGALTKRISLGEDGKLVSDGSHCILIRGTAHRIRLNSLHAFAQLIGGLPSNDAISLGHPLPDLPDHVEVTTDKARLLLNGHAGPTLISRTQNYITYTERAAALCLLDFDRKGMPASVSNRLRDLGGVVPALHSVLPELAKATTVTRASTSTGIWRTDTGERFPDSGGLHVFLLVRDGADIERFLKALHARCWLAGLGWMMVSAGGQLLERSLVDRMVGRPERLIFEGPPVLDAPLAQDTSGRKPVVTEGAALDTITACPPLSIVEQSRLRDLLARETHRLAPEAAKARETFIGQQTVKLATRTGMPRERAASIVARQCKGVLLPDVLLPFDDEELAGATVADMLADPGAGSKAPRWPIRWRASHTAAAKRE